MMSCREVCALAQEYADGHGSNASRVKIRLHMLFCRSCTSFVDQTRQTGQLVRQSLSKNSDTLVDPKLMAEFKKRSK